MTREIRREIGTRELASPLPFIGPALTMVYMLIATAIAVPAVMIMM